MIESAGGVNEDHFDSNMAERKKKKTMKKSVLSNKNYDP